MSPVIVLGYWDIRGLAEPIRLLLEYGGLKYEDRRHQMSKSDWLEYKHTLGFDFPNLPYYEDEEVKISQSKAIFRHLGRKLGLEGSTDRSKAEIDMMIEQVDETLQEQIDLCYCSDYSESLKQLWTTGDGEFARLGSLHQRLSLYDVKLGENDWFVENKLSMADFAVWELMDTYRLLFTGCLDPLPNLVRFMNSFSKLAGIKRYLEAPRYRAFPIWSERSSYGYYPTK